MHVIDTDVCVDALHGVPEAVDELAALEARGPLAVASITAHELWQGAFGSRDPRASCQAIDRFLDAFDILSYDGPVARVGGRLAADLRARGEPIGDLDTMIAATALEHDAPVVTRNRRHFRRVEGLSVHAL